MSQPPPPEEPEAPAVIAQWVSALRGTGIARAVVVHYPSGGPSIVFECAETDAMGDGRWVEVSSHPTDRRFLLEELVLVLAYPGDYEAVER